MAEIQRNGKNEAISHLTAEAQVAGQKMLANSLGTSVFLSTFYVSIMIV